MEKIIQIIQNVLKNRGKSPNVEITEKTHLRNDLGFDSLDLAELTVRIEAEYDIDIFKDGIIETVGEIMSKL